MFCCSVFHFHLTISSTCCVTNSVRFKSQIIVIITFIIIILFDLTSKHFLLQYTVYAQDLGTPQRTSQNILVTIRIQRNNFPPVFINEVYTADITNNFFSGSNIIQVTATDQDQIVSFLFMIHVMRKPVYAICEQQRSRSACASAESDQRLCCSLPR